MPLKKITIENLSLIKVYGIILDKCSNEIAIEFITSRVYRVLRKSYKARKPNEFPKITYDLHVVYLVDYLRNDKLTAAHLYSSSLNAQNRAKKLERDSKKPRGFLEFIMAYFKEKI